jgi:hypothetical protein
MGSDSTTQSLVPTSGCIIHGLSADSALAATHALLAPLGLADLQPLVEAQHVAGPRGTYLSLRLCASQTLRLCSCARVTRQIWHVKS